MPTDPIRATLPPHGPMSCRRCFPGSINTPLIRGRWQAINDPGAWGSQTPRVLVLGFSKGFTQANAYANGNFEDIPFKGMRRRLTEMLQSLGVLPETDEVGGKFAPGEKDFAFGSLVRCSLARRDNSGKLGCTGPIMPKAFVEEVASVTRTCAETYLTKIPDRTKLVLMLGTADSYVGSCMALIRSLHPSTFGRLNSMSYRASGSVFVHVSHPSGSNGHHSAWMSGGAGTKSGAKRKQAEVGVQAALGVARGGTEFRHDQK